MYHNGYSGGDAYGLESLTLINDYMSSHADEIVVIFAGYMNKMKETIFQAQPGLIRRIRWTFEIEPYTPKELAEIFRRQCRLNHHQLCSKFDIDAFFLAHHTKFPFHGGDIKKFINEIIGAYDERMFDSAVTGLDLDPVLRAMDVNAGFTSFVNAQIIDTVSAPPPEGMYI